MRTCMKAVFVLALCLSVCTGTAWAAPALLLNVPDNTFGKGDKVNASVSVVDSAELSGAYVVSLSFDTSALGFSGLVPLETGPFKIPPSASVSNGLITLAGFQGVSTTITGPYTVLAQLSFIARKAPTIVDSSSISCTQFSVYSTAGKPIALQLHKQTGTVLLPFVRGAGRPEIRYVTGRLTFTIPLPGKTSIHIYSLSGRLVNVPLLNKELIAGKHSVVAPKTLAGGFYLAVLDAAHGRTVGKVRILP